MSQKPESKRYASPAEADAWMRPAEQEDAERDIYPLVFMVFAVITTLLMLASALLLGMAL